MKGWTRAHAWFVVATVTFIGWTWATLRTTWFEAWDATSSTPAVDPMSYWGQILTAVATVASPVVVYAALLIGAGWAVRQRLHNLAWAFGVAVPLAAAVIWLAKWSFGRQRPPTVVPLITSGGYAYPSAHMAAYALGAVMLLAAMRLVRQRRAMVWLTAGGVVVVGLFIGYNRWALRAHWSTDIVGGTLLGVTLACLCLALAGVQIGRSVEEWINAGAERGGPSRRAAIVHNPTKIADPAVFRRQIEAACAERGWKPPLWLQTHPDDPGSFAVRRALQHGVDLVLVAGGDGTVRAACAALANTSTPLAILPVGTGNLLARNLGVPLDVSDAIAVAFDGDPRAIDLVTIRADGNEIEWSAVMAGMGADAAIMNETNEDLKRVVGPGAYVMAALSALGKPPFAARLAVDDLDPVELAPAMVLVANVGQIQGQIDLAPDAAPDDGLLDVVVASPKRVADWAAITAKVLIRASDAEGVDRVQAERLVVEADTEVPYQIDGDAVGSCRRLEAVVVPRAVRVMVPPGVRDRVSRPDATSPEPLGEPAG